MTVMSDRWIANKALHENMISPFFRESQSTLEHRPEQKCPSYGLSSYGYDVRLGRDFKVYKRAGDNPTEFKTGNPMFDMIFGMGTAKLEDAAVRPNARQFFSRDTNGEMRRHEVPYAGAENLVDPCNPNDDVMFSIPDCDQIVLPPQSFVLGVTMERLEMPTDVLGVCMGKSSVARAASIVIVTPLEPGWKGYITLEITNNSDNYLVLTAGMGITQILFVPGNEQCETSYADRAGKYQDQAAVAVPFR